MSKFEDPFDSFKRRKTVSKDLPAADAAEDAADAEDKESLTRISNYFTVYRAEEDAPAAKPAASPAGKPAPGPSISADGRFKVLVRILQKKGILTAEEADGILGS